MAANGTANTTRVRVITSFGPYWYLSCPSAGCTSKMAHTSETTVRCNACGRTVVFTAGDPRGSGATHRYRLKLRVVESAANTGRVFDVVFFGAAAESLFGVKCAELIQIATAISQTPPPSAPDDDHDECDARCKDNGLRTGSIVPTHALLIALRASCRTFPRPSP